MPVIVKKTFENRVYRFTALYQLRKTIVYSALCLSLTSASSCHVDGEGLVGELSLVIGRNCRFEVPI